MPELSGLDVYEGQGLIDWGAVPDLTFVSCKATQWREDRYFRRNWGAMRERGFPVRAPYHFNTTESASTQARRFHDVVGDLLPGEAPAIDFETDLPRIPILGRQDAIDLRNAIEDAFGRQAIIYIGYSYPNAAEIIGGRPWWFPSYGISEASARRQAMQLGLVPHIWQWGGGQHGTDVPGVTPGARDDSNQVLLPDELVAWAGSPSSATSKEDDDMPAAIIVLDPDGSGWWECFLGCPDRRLIHTPFGPDAELNPLKWTTVASGGQVLDENAPVDQRRFWMYARNPVVTGGGVDPKAIADQVIAAIGNSDGVDVHGLAKAVADELAARIQS